MKDYYEDDDTLIGFFANCIKNLNMFLLNGACGVIKYIFKILMKIPHWIKEFFLYGLPWLWKQLKRFINYIFSGAFWRLIWNTVLLCPAFAIFCIMFAWPSIGWYLTGRIDYWLFAEQVKWWWIGLDVIWMCTVGWFGVRYGLEDGIFENIADRFNELFLPKTERVKKSEERRQMEHRQRLEEERIKLEKARKTEQAFADMIQRNYENRNTIEKFMEIKNLIEKLKANSITEEENKKLINICIDNFGVRPEQAEDMIKTTVNYFYLYNRCNMI